jgi:hypothetical protein
MGVRIHLEAWESGQKRGKKLRREGAGMASFVVVKYA